MATPWETEPLHPPFLPHPGTAAMPPPFGLLFTPSPAGRTTRLDNDTPCDLDRLCVRLRPDDLPVRPV